MSRHFLHLDDFDRAALDHLLERSLVFKTHPRPSPPPLAGRTLALLFTQHSTRTRVAFFSAMAQLGGSSIFLAPEHSQLDRGEPIEDTACVLSRFVDAIVLRTASHEALLRFADAATVPVINGLSAAGHPCQLMADILTFQEHRGPITGCTVAWIGDVSNVCRSYMEAARLWDFQLRIATPEELWDHTQATEAHIDWTPDPKQAATGAHLVVTDVWVSMGLEQDSLRRRRLLTPYQVTPELMTLAHEQALFMHCLPAHRGEEVSAAVIDGAWSVVWDEAENRLHTQKALLEYLLLS
jgi:ornithine carbamoyltransferase